jgi:hypothetical protein
MRIFLSWSGELSRRVAIAFDDWLPSVIQSVQTWVSSADIESGTRWSDVLFRELEADSFGIACVTKQNPSAPWINFESGALAKQVTKARVVPFLFEMRQSDLPANHPFAQFNYVIYRQGQDNRETMLKLLSDINKANESQLTDTQLTNSFDAFWPKLDARLTQLVREAPVLLGQAAQENDVDVGAVLEELLQLTREQQREIRTLQARPWVPEPGTVAALASPSGPPQSPFPSEHQLNLPRHVGRVLVDDALSCEEKLLVIRALIQRIEPFLLRSQPRSDRPPAPFYRIVKTDQGTAATLDES